VFFFFQAEDGIRDDLVTGVQTCALPISSSARRARGGGRGISYETSHAQRISSTTCTGPSARISPLPTASKWFRNAYFGSAVSKQIGRASCRERGEIRQEAVSENKSTTK